ncbi:GDSL-type esterase/lipase family protein [Actinoplanes sp. NPDC051851]|uniref:GDSL-type esterase/lipase family protein n=1 Tax=Actinoplanes sp. NPDC051851 TaxID=3154753 RepID=UPI00341BE641
MADRWVHTWTAMPQSLPSPVDCGAVHQTVRVTVGGDTLRVRFSNAYGLSGLRISAATVAVPRHAGSREIVPGSARELRFGGHSSVEVPPGAPMVSDPVVMPLAPRSDLAITLRLGGPVSTYHPGSRTTSWLDSTPVDHWFVISGVEVVSAAPGLVLLGDSLTDGRGSTTNGNDRWPDLLAVRAPGIALLNQAAGGNQLLGDANGPNMLSRFDRDMLGVSGAFGVFVFAGVNDIGTGTPPGAVIAAYRQLVTRSHAAGLRILGATLTPFGGHEYDAAESSRTTVNAAIRGGLFDDYVDFDAAVRAPGSPSRLAPPYDTGDHLHLNPPGYATLANTFPLHWLDHGSA